MENLKFLVNMGDYDLIQNIDEPNEITKLFHENVLKGRKVNHWYTDDEIDELLEAIHRYDNTDDPYESEAIVFWIEDRFNI